MFNCSLRLNSGIQTQTQTQNRVTTTSIQNEFNTISISVTIAGLLFVELRAMEEPIRPIK